MHFATFTRGHQNDGNYVVAELVSRSTMHLDGLGPDLILNTQEVGVQFKPDSCHCRVATNLLDHGYPAVLKYMCTTEPLKKPLLAHPERDAFKPLVLLSHVATCCELPFLVRN